MVFDAVLDHLVLHKDDDKDDRAEGKDEQCDGNDCISVADPRLRIAPRLGLYVAGLFAELGQHRVPYSVQVRLILNRHCISTSTTPAALAAVQDEREQLGGTDHEFAHTISIKVDGFSVSSGSKLQQGWKRSEVLQMRSPKRAEQRAHHLNGRIDSRRVTAQLRSSYPGLKFSVIIRIVEFHDVRAKGFDHSDRFWFLVDRSIKGERFENPLHGGT